MQLIGVDERDSPMCRCRVQLPPLTVPDLFVQHGVFWVFVVDGQKSSKKVQSLEEESKMFFCKGFSVI